MPWPRFTANVSRMYPTLISEEIREVFADVRDDAKVQDKSGTEALNYWYANGSFTNQ